MRILFRLICASMCFIFLFTSVSSADFLFSDDRFRAEFTTENIDRIIEEYELLDGWYWTTPALTAQTFHGLEDAPGWTDSAVNKYHRNNYIRGMYGCRWLANQIFTVTPGTGGYGECFGFAMFIGYLLTGDYNPYKAWDTYYGLTKSDGLRVGDIVRTEFDARGKHYGHSAVVYSVDDDQILFIQVSGSSYNRISIGTGFMDGYHDAPFTLEELRKIPNLKVCRSPQNGIN